MNCTNCNSVVAERAKFCGTCGKSILSEKPPENKKPVGDSNDVKKTFQVIASILFVLSLGTMSSQYNSGSLIRNIDAFFNIFAGIAVIMIFVELWKNRKTGKKWFGWRWIILLVIISLVGFGTVIFSQVLTLARQKAMSNPDLKAEYINNAVEAIKAKMYLPKQINDSTFITNITAEKNAVRYHYLLSGIDTNNLSSESQKNYLISSGICQSEGTRGLFDKGVDLEFVYNVKDSEQSYLVQFNQSDCR